MIVNPRRKHRNTTAGLATKYGQGGEICVDTTKNTAVVMDGATAGGFPLAKESSEFTTCEDDTYIPLDIGTITSDFALPANNDELGLRTWIKKFGSILQAHLSTYINGTCSTASATADKVVSLTGYSLVSGARFYVTFSNKNSVAGALTMNVNSTGAKTICHADGTAISATTPAYFVANCPIEFWYDGTNFRFKQELIKSYLNTDDCYRLYNDGFVEQYGKTLCASSSAGVTTTVTLLVSMINSTYSRMISNNSNYVGQRTQTIGSATTTTISIIAYQPSGTENRLLGWEVKGYAA